MGITHLVRQRHAIVSLAIVAVMAAAAVAAAPAPAEARVRYRQPVDAPISDGWRPPPHPYGPGNRGVEYSVGEQTEVRAAADGTVTFAGQVGGRLYVVIRHADRIRTTLGGLTSIDVTAGQRVVGGQRVGWATGSLHWGARQGSTYINPLLLLNGLPARLIARTG
jgi:murein DD-endopeptidase MepM/ murein hydrolase activator NlpD